MRQIDSLNAFPELLHRAKTFLGNTECDNTTRHILKKCFGFTQVMKSTTDIAPLATDSADQLAEIRQLLSASDLPTVDISPSASLLFFGCRSENRLVGVIGLEVYGTVALLRSLAVDPTQSKHGLGKSLADFAEAHAASLGVESLFLLTTTADAFFSGLGYAPASRDKAPVSIKNTSQFSGLCPASSVFMCKRL
jgi:amino-acid N-acetyltransferase